MFTHQAQRALSVFSSIFFASPPDLFFLIQMLRYRQATTFFLMLKNLHREGCDWFLNVFHVSLFWKINNFSLELTGKKKVVTTPLSV